MRAMKAETGAGPGLPQSVKVKPGGLFLSFRMLAKGVEPGYNADSALVDGNHRR